MVILGDKDRKKSEPTQAYRGKNAIFSRNFAAIRRNTSPYSSKVICKGGGFDVPLQRQKTTNKVLTIKTARQ